jgi:hypothetical protein
VVALGVVRADRRGYHGARWSARGRPRDRLVCFAGSGPGEVFVDAKKAVGITQWRVREGMFLSSVLPTHSSTTVLELLKSVPEGLSDALEHHVLSSLGEVSSSELLEVLRVASGPWTVRPFDFTLSPSRRVSVTTRRVVDAKIGSELFRFAFEWG